MRNPQYPALFQINTRIWLNELREKIGQPLTLEDIPDSYLDEIVRLGFDWVWLLGVWQTGDIGRRIAMVHPDLQYVYQEVLPDFTERDICSSPFAISKYEIRSDLGGNQAINRFRERLNDRGVRFMLDFVPNHTALDHSWVYDHPEYYIHADETNLTNEPYNYIRINTCNGSQILAHGRDPYFPAWTDTLQLNFRNPGLREAMKEELIKIAGLCDGVRCDMAMLLQPDVITRTWGDKSVPIDGSQPVDTSFWAEAIEVVHQVHPNFLFIAEVYWDLEWNLQGEGFDFTYDKKLYDLLRTGDTSAIRGHLLGDLNYQRKSVRFLENHDEPRAASLFSLDKHRAAAILSFLIPGMRFFHEGQLVGRQVKVPMQLCRRPSEPVDNALWNFYQDLLKCISRPIFKNGSWQLLECVEAWEGNPSWQNFILYYWEPPSGGKTSGSVLVIVNFGHTQSQCFVRLPFSDLKGNRLKFLDQVNTEVIYDQEGDDLANRGLYLDMPAWGYHVFEVVRQ